MTAGKSSVMDYEVHRALLPAEINSNAINIFGRHLTGQMYNDLKHILKATQDYFKAKRCFVMVTTYISLAAGTTKGKNKQELKTASVKAAQNITREETELLVMSMGSRVRAIIDCRRIATK